MWRSGSIRDTFGDLERYRELSYEDLARRIPATALGPVFDWLGRRQTTTCSTRSAFCLSSSSPTSPYRV